MSDLFETGQTWVCAVCGRILEVATLPVESTADGTTGGAAGGTAGGAVGGSAEGPADGLVGGIEGGLGTGAENVAYSTPRAPGGNTGETTGGAAGSAAGDTGTGGRGEVGARRIVSLSHSRWDLDHEGAGDHEPVPILHGTEAVLRPRARCDFCHRDLPPVVPSQPSQGGEGGEPTEAGWVIPVADFEMQPGTWSGAEWLACEPCAALIERDQWSGLLRRSAAAWTQRHGHEIPPDHLDAIGRLYRKVRKNITGAPKPRSEITP